MKLLKYPIAFALGAVLAGGVVHYLYQDHSIVQEGEKVVTAQIVEITFEDIAELATETYTSNAVGVFEQEKASVLGGRVHIPFTGKHLAIAYDATVKAGIADISQAKASIDAQKKVVQVAMPKGELLDAYIEPESISVIDQSNSVINRVTADDMADLLAEEVENARENALENGVLDKAREHAEAVIASHVKALLKGTQYEGFALNITWAE